jgi:hypothetical protein
MQNGRCTIADPVVLRTAAERDWYVLVSSFLLQNPCFLTSSLSAADEQLLEMEPEVRKTSKKKGKRAK